MFEQTDKTQPETFPTATSSHDSSPGPDERETTENRPEEHHDRPANQEADEQIGLGHG